jgi:hypothetical protein
MPRIPSTHLKTGMILTREVLNMHGNCLLPEATALEDEDILNLAAWGIHEVEVMSVDGYAEDRSHEEERAEVAREEIEARLARQNFSNPIVQQLMNLCIRCNLEEANR